MRSQTNSARCTSIALLLSGFILASACGSDPKPEPKTAANTTTATPSSKPGEAKTAPLRRPEHPHGELDQHRRRHPQGVRNRSAQGALRLRLGQRAGARHHHARSGRQVLHERAAQGRSAQAHRPRRPRGETEYNFVLGNSRADAVGGFLRSKGMDKAKIDTTSRGELDATGTDEPGWARDRRVDLMLGQ